jgi:hypothetical protein
LSAILLLGDVEFEDHGPDERATIANMQTLEVSGWGGVVGGECQHAAP